jgi:hypothetical protein
MTLTDPVKNEMLALAHSVSLREDMRALRRLRSERDRKMTAAQFVAFATAASTLAGHPLKPRRPFFENDMRL